MICPFTGARWLRHATASGTLPTPICESFGADSSDSSSGDGPHRAFRRDARKFFFWAESGVPETSFAWRAGRLACCQEATQAPSYQLAASQKRPFDSGFLQSKDCVCLVLLRPGILVAVVGPGRECAALRTCARMSHRPLLDVKDFFFFPLVVIEMECLRFAQVLDATPPLGSD
jgi:hypothetical protein